MARSPGTQLSLSQPRTCARPPQATRPQGRQSSPEEPPRSPTQWKESLLFQARYI